MAEEKKVDLLNVDKKITDGVITKVEIPTAPEAPKKRGRKSFEEMTEEEQKEYLRKKEEREKQKALEKEQEKENKRIAEETGYSPTNLVDIENVVSIELAKEFIAKCKKEKINSADYENIIFALCRKWVDGEIELKRRVKTEFY